MCLVIIYNINISKRKMNPEEASQVLRSMVDFIRSHGKERVDTINKQALDEFTIQKEKYIAEEKERLTQEYKNRLQQDEIKLRIKKSAEQNAQRIKKMKTINTLVEKIYSEAKQKMASKQQSDGTAYKELMKNLIVQVRKHIFLLMHLINTSAIGTHQVHGARSQCESQKVRLRRSQDRHRACC